MKKTALILAVIAAFAASGCASDDGSGEIAVPIYETNKIEYKTEKAEIGDISQKYYAEGSFGYPYNLDASFKIDGKVKSVNVEDKDPVEKGDILCVLDSEDLDKQLEEKQLYIDQAQKTVDTLLNEGGSATEIELARAELELVQLEYDHLEETRDDYNVYAPCDGIFRADKNTSFGNGIDDQRGAENIVIKGADVKAGQLFGTVEDHSQQYLVCNIYDVEPENVNFGTRVSLTQGATEAKGKVIDLWSGDSGGMSVYTYIIQPDEDSGLSEMNVDCCFEVYSKIDTVIVPAEAVTTTKDRSYVNLLIDGAKVEQDVEVGIEDGERTEILSGLAGGEDVIIN